MTFKARIFLVNLRDGRGPTVEMNVDPHNVPSKEEILEFLNWKGFPPTAWKPIGVVVIRTARDEEVRDGSTFDVEDQIRTNLGTH